MAVLGAPQGTRSAPPAADALSSRAVELRASEWESAFFGARMGAIVTTHGEVDGTGAADHQTRTNRMARDLAATLREAADLGYAHVIFRTPGEDVAAVWAAESAGMRLVDVGVDLRYALAPASPGEPQPTPALTIRAGSAADTPALKAMTVGAFAQTRFAVDPFFSGEQVTAFYQQWAANLFAGLADVVLVCEIDGRPAGFISCARSGEEGRIPLVATDVAFRRRGVGRELVAAALRWFAVAGCREARVKTQVVNYPALALYERAGFVVYKTELTFSAALRSPRATT